MLMGFSPMAGRTRGIIQFVGRVGFDTDGTDARTTTISSGLTGGIDTGAKAGDLVLVFFANSDTEPGDDDFVKMASSAVANDYTVASPVLAQDATGNISNFLRYGYKIMPSTPDTGVYTEIAESSTSDSAACCITVWRNVDRSSPLDVTPTTASGINSGIPNPPAITPATPNSKIIIVGSASLGEASGVASPSGYTRLHTADRTIETNEISIWIDTKTTDWQGGTEDPGAYGVTTGGVDDCWTAATIALRPA